VRRGVATRQAWRRIFGVVSGSQSVSGGRSDESDLAEEIADVEIMLEQARQILDANLIDEAKEKKLARLKRRLQEAGSNV
jgi:hypothetical protein